MGVKGGLSVGGAPRMHNILGVSRVGHLHLGRSHVHGSSHEGMVLSGVRSLMSPALIRVKQWVVGQASRFFAFVCIALLCRFVLGLFFCFLMQHDSRWRHVPFGWDVHRLHVGYMSCLRTWFFFFSSIFLCIFHV